MATGPGLVVESPQRRPSVGGLLSVVTPIDSSDPHVALGIGYIAEGCTMPQFAPGLCWDILGTEGTKSFDGIDSITSDPFATYTGVECGLMESEDYEARATKAHADGESYGVEKGLQISVLNSADTVILPGTGVSIVDGIAALEQYASENYPGMPMIHLDRRLATLGISESVIFPSLDFSLTTGLGTPVAAGGGYNTSAGPDGQPVPAAGSYWAYVTGQVNVWRTPIVTARVDNVEINRARALAERVYVVTVECIVAAILINTTLSGGGGVGPAGASAYEIAVDNGFVGTEQEWLDSLVGADGTDGTDGTNATITSVSATGLAAGANPTVTAGGTPSARTFAFGIPAGEDGAPGDPGDPGAPGVVQSVVQGTGITVDSTDPANPIISTP